MTTVEGIADEVEVGVGGEGDGEGGDGKSVLIEMEEPQRKETVKTGGDGRGSPF
jgi:hypothetical protein